MGYSVSQETYERCERNRAAGRLCQGSGRCSTRATRIAVCLLHDNGAWHWQTFVVCKKHADEMTAWPSFANGATLAVTMLSSQASAAEIAQTTRAYNERIITQDNIKEAEHRMRVDEARRAAWSKS